MNDDGCIVKHKILSCEKFLTNIQSFNDFIINNVPDKFYGTKNIIDLVMCCGVVN